MTDAHCHVSCGDPAVREFLVGRDFVGIHPWEADKCSNVRMFECSNAELRERLVADPRLGVGEIGLDRLRTREISAVMREVFEAQLKLAFEFNRPIVLHGAKCWGQVVTAVKSHCPPPPFTSTFLFHGFSRSDGLLPDIVRLNGFISVGPAILNDHAVNYRALAKRIPADRLLVETDRTAENAATCPAIRDILEKLAEVRGESAAELERVTDANASRFRGTLV